MIKMDNLFNDNYLQIASLGDLKVFEFQRDLSVTQSQAVNEFYGSKMNVRKRQLLIKLDNKEYVISAGLMQWTSGSIKMTSDVKGVGDLVGKMFSGKVTGESAIKPKYSGKGVLALEPTYKHILLENVEDWNGMVLDDGLFLACDASINQKVVARSNLSSAVLGKEGLFNLCLTGNGVLAIESPVARKELITITLENDEFKLDGNFAIAWSNSLNFTVEKSTKSLLGSAVSGEGFVNVYKGTGKILVAPIY